jgi:transcriptional regulator with XRE-family HTH domain
MANDGQAPGSTSQVTVGPGGGPGEVKLPGPGEVRLPGQQDTSEMLLVVGASVRMARKRRRMTLQDLADQTGVSVSMLSMLERGVASPSIGTLVSVSSALGLHMAQLFQDPSAQAPSPVRRRADQVVIQAAEGVSRRLVHTDVEHDLEMVINEYEPGTSSSETPVHHDGMEFGLILSGTLTVSLEDVEYVLDPGDGIAYSSSTPHVLSNNGPAKARAVWINVAFRPESPAER